MESTELRVELLDPHDLAPHPRNIRADLGDLAGLTESIREQGVIEPLTVVPINGTGFQLIAGHRRAAAAIAAGLDAVPCVVRADLAVDSDDSPGVAEHIGAMLAENLQREGLTAMEEARGVAQMLDLGMPVAKVARRTGLGQKRVKKAAGVARLDPESAAEVDAQQLDLESAAVIALFADDPEARGRLLHAAERGPGQLAHAVEQIKRQRKADAQLQARAAELRAAGRVVVEDFAPAGARLTRLNDADGTWLADREAEHLSCPGAAVHLATTSWEDRLHEEEICTDWKANGHVDRWASSTASGSPKPETEEEKKAARAERREVIENNKAMAAANAVRRTWIREFLARRSAPKEVLRFAVEELAANPRIFERWLTGMPAAGDGDAATEQLGLVKPGRTWGDPAQSLTSGEQVPDARLPLQLLAHVAGAIESSMAKDSWRGDVGMLKDRARWLRFLVAQGYTLSDVEQLVVDGASE
ncbi:ParB/RepB/Spo0J family partition protein [Blastococcus sp. CCUG 61487]|uniref:ParB/RepB/Spo0J family partition protein n=1 Tax=Blastococcus sp. CCUG 61487 TaxID=1840703 RepID=UPI00201D7450|nr:ParB/RepB/Spo0J family partition protein [Blastococcus sp. CCUG 61487]